MTSILWRPLRESEKRISYLSTFLSRDNAQYFATISTLHPVKCTLNSTLRTHFSTNMYSSCTVNTLKNPRPENCTLDPPKNVLNIPLLRHYSTLTSNPTDKLLTNQILLSKIEKHHQTTNFWSPWNRRFALEFHSGSKYLTSKCSDGNKPPAEKSDKKPGALKAEMAKCKESGAVSTDTTGCKDTKAVKSDSSAATPRGETRSTGTSSSSTTASSSGELLVLGEIQTLQNFHMDCIVKINSQINSELTSAYVYLSMASFLRQDNVALLGFAKYFSQASIEETEHAEKLVQYLNTRGGQLQLTPIAAPGKHEWKSMEQLLGDALSLEKHLNEDLLKLHACASSHGDAHLSDFIETEYLPEQVKAIKQLADLITIVKRLGHCLLHIVDRDLMNGVYSNHGK